MVAEGALHAAFHVVDGAALRVVVGAALHRAAVHAGLHVVDGEALHAALRVVDGSALCVVNGVAVHADWTALHLWKLSKQIARIIIIK